MELLGILFSTVLGGGATGLLGIFIQRYFDNKGKAQELELIKENNRLAEALADKENARAAISARALEHQADQERIGRIGQAAEERQAVEAQADAATRQASYDNDAARFLTPGVLGSKSKPVLLAMAFVDAVRGLIRPVLTGYLVWISHAMYSDLQRLLAIKGDELETAVVKELLVMVIQTLLYLASTAMTWWFGSRPSQPAKK